MGLVGFAGQMASGKTTAARALAAARGQSVRSFAAGVRDVFGGAFGFDQGFIEANKRSQKPPAGFSKTIREALQVIGDGFRQIRADVWIEKAFRDMPPGGVVFDDVRYLSEARAIKSQGGQVVLLWRPGFEPQDQHPSESQLLPILRHCIQQCWSHGLPSALFAHEFRCKTVPDSDLFDLFLVNFGPANRLEELALGAC